MHYKKCYHTIAPKAKSSKAQSRTFENRKFCNLWKFSNIFLSFFLPLFHISRINSTSPTFNPSSISLVRGEKLSDDGKLWNWILKASSECISCGYFHSLWFFKEWKCEQHQQWWVVGWVELNTFGGVAGLLMFVHGRATEKLENLILFEQLYERNFSS